MLLLLLFLLGGGGGVVVILLLLVVDVISWKTCSAIAVAHSAHSAVAVVVVVAVSIHHHSTSPACEIRCSWGRDHGTFSCAVDADDFGSIGATASDVIVRSIVVVVVVFVSSNRQREGRFFLVVVAGRSRSRSRSRTISRLHPRQIPSPSSRSSSNSRTIPHRILKIILHSTTITEFISIRMIRMDDMMIVISIHLTLRQPRRTFFLFRSSSTSSTISCTLRPETKARL